MKTANKPNDYSINRMVQQIATNESLKSDFKANKINARKFYKEFNFELFIKRIDFGSIISTHQDVIKFGKIIKVDGNFDFKTTINGGSYFGGDLVTIYKTRYFTIDGSIVINHSSDWYMNRAEFNGIKIPTNNNCYELFAKLFDMEGIEMICNISANYRKKILSSLLAVASYSLPKSLIKTLLEHF